MTRSDTVCCSLPRARLTLAPAVFAVVALAGCSASQGYEAVRSAGQASAQCEREPTVTAQHECEAAYQTDYEAYRKQREEIVSD